MLAKRPKCCAGLEKLDFGIEIRNAKNGFEKTILILLSNRKWGENMQSNIKST
jgi:hypothetical protein